MKKHFLGSAWVRICTALLILSISFIVYSCHKEAKLTVQEINAAKAAQNFSIRDASTWFNENKSNLANKIKLTADVEFLKDLSDFKPQWDSARTAIDTNYYVVEAPARYAKRWGFNTDSAGANINGLTRLLVLRSKKYGSTTAVLMHIHGNPGVNAANVHYMNVPQTFSGNIFYTSLQGASINGYIYKSGKIILSSSGKSNTTKPAGPQILDLAPGECQTITSYWYEQTCYYTPDDNLIGCTAWQYTHTTIETYCAPSGGNDGGGGVVPPNCPPDTGGGDSGGNNPPPNDPPPGGGIITITKVGGKLIVKINDDNSGGNSPCTPLTQSILDSIDAKYICAKYVLAQFPQLKDSLSQLINKTFNTTGSHDITFKDVPAHNLKDTTEDGECRGYNIWLNQDVLAKGSGEYILATMYHEALHAFLNLELATLGNDAFHIKYPEVHIVESPIINASGMLSHKFTFDEGNRVTTVLGDLQHRTMAEYFIDKMITGILAYNPNFPPERARALARYGIFVDTTILDMNNRERDKTKGESVGIKCP